MKTSESLQAFIEQQICNEFNIGEHALAIREMCDEMLAKVDTLKVEDIKQYIESIKDQSLKINEFV